MVNDRYRIVKTLREGAEPIYLAEDSQSGVACVLWLNSGLMPPRTDGMKPLSALIREGPLPLSKATAIGMRAALLLDMLAVEKLSPRAFSADGIWAKGAADVEREEVMVMGPFDSLGEGAKGRSFQVLAGIFYELAMGSSPGPGAALPFELHSAQSVKGAVDALAHLLGKGDPQKRAALAMEVVRASDIVARLRPPSLSITNESGPDSFGLALPQSTPKPPPSSSAQPVADAKTGQLTMQKAVSRPAQSSLPDSQGHNAFVVLRSYVVGLAAITVAVVVAAAVRPSDWERDDVVPAAVASAVASAGGAEKEKPSAKPVPSAVKEVVVTLSAAELRAAAEKNLRTGNAGGYITSLEQLFETEPSAAAEREIKNGIIETLMRVMMGDNANADRLFALIEHKMGTNGPDLLYELLTTRGGSRAAKRAEEMLGSAEFREKGTPEFRIAYDFRMAKTCADKEALFERAGKDGDKRVLGPMQMMNRDCGGRRGGECCFSKSASFKAALDELKKRYPQ